MLRRRTTALVCAALAAAVSLAAVPAPDDPGLAAPADGGPIRFAPQGVTTDRFARARTPEVVELVAEDGVVLHGRLFRPDTSSEPGWEQPVILVHSPYYNQRTREPNTRSLDLVERFTPKGYAVLLTDVRGTGNSGGCASQDGEDQARDFATWVDWAASQPWSNGRVGGYGKSYDAETQSAGYRYAGEGLATMVAVAGISSLYDVGFFDGVPVGAGALLGATVYTPTSLDPPTSPSALPRYPEKAACQPANFVAGADLRGDMTPYWAEREFRFGLDETSADVSVLHVHGWLDRTVTPIGIDGWYDELPGFTRAIWGQWAHFYPYDAPARVARDDWYDTIHAWFDRFLLGLDTGVESWPPVQTQSEDGSWSAARSYAELGAEQVFALTASGGLAPVAAPAEEGTTTVAASEAGTTAWTTAPFADGLRLSGQAHLDVELALDRPDAHLVATLQEVRANGTVRTLTAGALSAMHRVSLSQPALVPLGAALPYRIQSMPFDVTLAPGSSLRVTLSGSSGTYLTAGTRWTGQVTVDGVSTLRVPVVTSPCGIAVAARTPVPAQGCAGGVPDHPEPVPGFTETSRGPVG
jgi:predicted acyl esterase